MYPVYHCCVCEGKGGGQRVWENNVLLRPKWIHLGCCESQIAGFFWGKSSQRCAAWTWISLMPVSRLIKSLSSILKRTGTWSGDSLPLSYSFDEYFLMSKWSGLLRLWFLDAICPSMLLCLDIDFLPIFLLFVCDPDRGRSEIFLVFDSICFNDIGQSIRIFDTEWGLNLGTNSSVRLAINQVR